MRALVLAMESIVRTEPVVITMAIDYVRAVMETAAIKMENSVQGIVSAAIMYASQRTYTTKHATTTTYSSPMADRQYY